MPVSVKKLSEDDLEKLLETRIKKVCPQATEDAFKSIDFWVPSSCEPLNWSTGGGLPGGRMTEIYGPWGGGKTLLALDYGKSIQRMGGKLYYIDAEHALDRKWVRQHGVATNRMKYYQPDFLEEALGIMEAICDVARYSDIPRLIVFDSVPALMGSVQEKRGYEDGEQIGVESKMIGTFLRRVLRKIKNSKITLLLINQVRVNIGARYGQEAESTPRGSAIPYGASLRIRVHRKELMKASTPGAVPHGAFLKTYVKKNKCYRPFLEADFPIFFMTGIDNRRAVSDYAIMKKTIPSSGNIVTFRGKKIRRATLREMMKTDPKVMAEVRKLAKDAYEVDF